MRKRVGFKQDIAKRAVTIFMSISILLGSIAGYGEVALAAKYDSDETVIETGNLNKNGTTVFNGEISTTKNLTDMHDGIIRMLDDNTETYDELQYGDENYANENAVFANKKIQVNASNIKLANLMVAEGDITFNASTMRSDEYVIIYSKSGDIRFNIGDMDFAGIIYAPNGEVTFSSSDVCIQGRIVASEINIYAGVFEIDGLEKYSNMVEMLEFLSNDIVLDISRDYDEEKNKYSINITSDNQDEFDKLEIYIRYDNEKKFSYLCELSEFKDVQIADRYDMVDLIVKGTTKYNEIIYSNVRSFHMDGEKVLYAHLDTDEDKIADGEEIIITNTNPYEADSDGDGLSDYVECFYLLTDPNSKTEDDDYDNDGLSNFAEVEQGTNPFLPDCDMDGLLDGKDREPLVYEKTGIEPDYTSACVVIGKYDKIINGCGENGEIYQYIFNYMTDQIKSICYNDEEIAYFYDVDSNMISDIRRYQDKYRINSSKYDVNGNVVTYSNNTNVYEYTYDEFSNVTSATVNGNPIVTMLDEEIVYGNGDVVSVEEFDNGYLYFVNGEETYLVTSDAEHEIEKYQHYKLGIEYEYKYIEDVLDYIVTNTGYKVQYSGDEDKYIVNYTYDDVCKQQIIYLNSESPKTVMISGDCYKEYTSDDNVIYSISDLNDTFFEVKYAFEGDNIVKVLYNDNKEISYTYNQNNQITSVEEGGNKVWEYEYNLLGQLKSAYNYIDKTVEKYSYDMYNNIKNVQTYAYDGEIGECLSDDTYEYESYVNADRVTSYNGVKLAYDEIGNPLRYYDGKEFSWSGRNLDSIQMTNEYAEYAYDKNGLRVQKNVDGKVTNYYYEGEDIIVEASDEHVIWYIYDDTTNVLGFSYDGKDYYYIKNASKDVVAIVDDNGEYICGYDYDPWGNLLSIDGDEKIADINPIRYRSYYYDDESGFYYLKTRYYDPEIRRFISMDDVCDVAYEMVDPNLYAYCCNDPVNLYDPEGRAYTKIAIFTIKQFESHSKNYLEDDIRDNWTTTVYIEHKVSDSNETFKKWWNGLESKDMVIIFAHGTPKVIMKENADEKNDELYFFYGDISSDLYKKDIKLLVIIACNCGHYSYYSQNIAWAFSQKITGVVLASDGTVSVTRVHREFEDQFIQMISNPGEEFQSWKPTKDKSRSNYGWLIYDKTKKTPKQTGLYNLNMYAVYRLYNQKIWMPYK